jgi:diguanylate cyclase (GGDEF)-like protein
MILPLNIDKIKIGYLAARNVKEEDKDKFNILAQQFLVGMKRSLLYKRVQELAITDSLTQLFSRRYFLERFEEELKRSKKFKLMLSFLMIDIDRFKEFNDRYGHLVGDAILREVSRTIKENTRQVDFMGRYGGEELSIVLTDTDKKQAYFAAERIRAAVESELMHVYDEDLKATISIGISSFPDDALEVKTLIEKADKALYLAKQQGRNRIC